MKTAWDDEICNALSWRGILAQRIGAENLNLSVGGSSNQKQFRLATEFFSHDFKKLKDVYDRISVIWGITSTARNEIFCLATNDQKNFFYNIEDDFSKFFVKHSYSHQNEVNMLARQMRHWNDFFESHAIENHWFDTFNTHNYHTAYHGVSQDQYHKARSQDWPSYEDFMAGRLQHVGSEIFSDVCRTLDIPRIDRLVCGDKCPRDLAYLLAVDQGFTDEDYGFHSSGWHPDCKRIEFLSEMNMLNPYSYHPTREAHQTIANILFDEIYG